MSRDRIVWLAVLVAVVAAATLFAINVGVAGTRARQESDTLEKAAASGPPLYVGLRRSSYGLRAKNADDAWWAARAKEYAANFPGATPMVLEIISGYQDDGSTNLEFARPEADKGPAEHMKFAPGGIDHDRALSVYDRESVRSILQLESGNSDVGRCFEIAWARFKSHPSIAGFAIDAEWYFTKGSPENAGKPIDDADAKKWMEQVLGYNKDFVLVLKHWDATHMPKTYRHPNLWMLSDSQDFKTRAEWLKDLAGWATAFKGSTAGFQFGYPKDRPWWSKETAPAPVTLGRLLLEKAPSSRCLLWVDFTAEQVEFKAR
jgi:hypothetical protein